MKFCAGWGWLSLKCPVMVPADRTLCHFCRRSKEREDA